MKKNKSIIVLISVILILAIAGAVFAYLYISTDIFKSNKELFAKYFGQNETILQDFENLEVIKIFEKLKEQNKYEINTNVDLSYSEGGEISNTLNGLAFNLDIQRNKEEKYAYLKGQLLYENEEYIQTELIKEKDVYGIRFADAFQQFITLKRDESFGNIMNDFGLSDEQIDQIRELLDNETIEENKEQIITIEDKYANIIKSTIAKGEYSKQKDINVSYLDNTINANSYTTMIDGQKIQSMIEEILNNIKNEELLVQNIDEQYDIEEQIDGMIKSIKEEIEIPAIKITVYEYKQKTVKTVFEIGKYSITIENINQEQGNKVTISYGETGGSSQVEAIITKVNSENEEKIEIVVNLLDGDEVKTITFSNLIEIQTQIKINTEIGYKQGITTITVAMKNEINVEDAVKKSETLGEQNSKSLNSIKSESRKEVIEKLKKLTEDKIKERINLLSSKIITGDLEEENTDNSTTQAEINKFNAKFEFYTGDEVSAENVKMILDVVRTNLGSYEFLNSEDTDNTDSKLNVKLNIEKDSVKEEAIQEILKKISSNKKYKVSIEYNDTNGLINYITITEI